MPRKETSELGDQVWSSSHEWGVKIPMIPLPERKGQVQGRQFMSSCC